MTRKYLVPLGLVGLSSDPTGSSAGQTYYNTATNKIRVYNGTGWEDSGLSAQDLENGSLQNISLSGSGDFVVGTDGNLVLDSGTGNAVYLESVASGNEVITTSALNSALQTVSAGTQGAQGANGSDGIQGAQGIEGVQGAQGANAGILTVGTGLNLSVAGEIAVDTTVVATKDDATLTGTLTLDGSGDFTVDSDSNIVFQTTSPNGVYIGSATSANEVLTAATLESGSLQSLTLGGDADFTIDTDANLILNPGVGSTAYLESATAGNEIVTTSALSDAIAGSTLGSTDDLTEGATNLYFSEARVVTALDSGSLQSISLGGAGDFTINSDANLVLNPASGSTVYLDAATAGNEVVVTSALNSAIAAAALQGVQGLQGSAGADGAQGATGLQGAVGETGATGTWSYIGAVTSTSGSAVAFSGLGGVYKELFLTFNDVTTSTQNSVNYFRINNDSNGSNYSIAASRDYGGNTYSGSAISSIYGCIGTMIAFGTNSSGTLTIKNAASTSFKGVSLSFKGRYSDWITSNYVPDITESLGGAYLGTSAVSSININLASGNFTSGTWKLWGLQ